MSSQKSSRVLKNIFLKVASGTSASYNLLLKVLRWEQISITFVSVESLRAIQKGVTMSVALKEMDKVAGQIAQLEEESRATSEHLKQIALLEKNVEDCNSAAVADEITQIQLIVDEANRLADGRKFYFLMKKIDETISKIEKFHENYEYPLPQKIFADLNRNLEIHQKNISNLERSLKRLRRSLKDARNSKRINSINGVVRGLEGFAKASEGNLEFFSYGVLRGLEDSLRSMKGEKTSKKNHTTKGLGFIAVANKQKAQLNKALEVLIRNIEAAKTFVLSARSAEAKAIARIQSDEPIEWMEVRKPGQAINIDKINARLKQRGYSIQFQCEDKPTGQE